MKAALPVLFLVLTTALSAQGRRLPDFSFRENSIEFADANRSYNSESQYVDTLSDAVILRALLQIMQQNPGLTIEVLGHTSMNEDTLLGRLRADTIRNFLLVNGVDSHRVVAVNQGYREPVISEAIIGSLPTAIEVEAANQKNRRVQVRIIAVKEEEQ